MIEKLQNRLYDEQRKHRDELLEVNIQLVCAKSDLKAARYEIEGLKRQIEILKECIDNDIKRRMEVLG